MRRSPRNRRSTHRLQSSHLSQALRTLRLIRRGCRRVMYVSRPRPVRRREQESKEETQCLDETPVRASESGASSHGPSEGGSSSGSGPAPRTGGRPAGGPGGRPSGGPGGRGKFFPPQEGLQALHREDRCHPLPRCPSAARLCGRAPARLCLVRLTGVCTTNAMLFDPRHQAGSGLSPCCHSRPGAKAKALSAGVSWRGQSLLTKHPDESDEALAV